MNAEPALGWSCHGCGEFFARYPGIVCPKCHAEKMNLGLPPEAAAEEDKPHPLGRGLDGVLVRRATRIPYLDRILDPKHEKGAVVGHVILVTGEYGAGKTTLTLHVLAGAERALFLSAEQPENDIVARAREMGIVTEGILFCAETEIGRIERLVLEHQPTDLVIDSLQCVYDGESGRPSGSAWTNEQVMKRLFKLAHGLKVTTWVIGHVNVRGQAKGSTAIRHWNDVHLELAKNKDGSRALGAPRKNRGGATNVLVRLALGELGLSEISDACAADGTCGAARSEGVPPQGVPAEQASGSVSARAEGDEGVPEVDGGGAGDDAEEGAEQEGVGRGHGASAETARLPTG